MIFIDTRTVLISYIISNVICASMMITLRRQNRRRSPELIFWMADFIMQFIGVVLLNLRGILPDFFSIVLSNILIVGGTFLLLIGLERYLHKPGPQWHNHLFMAAFVLIHLFFVFNQPNMLIRTLNNSLGIFVFCSQGAWLLLWRVEPSVRQDTWGAGAVFAGFSLVSLFRIFVNLIVPPENDLFKSGLLDTLVILIYQMLTISLALSLFLMVNQRLNKEIQQDKENLELIFNTSPDAVLVTRITDGYFIDFNEGFTAMTGYSRADVLGKSALEIDLWKDASERQKLVAALNEKGYYENMEAVFQRKDKSELIGSVSARLISLQGVSHIISVTRDITEGKLAEKALRESEEKLKTIIETSPDGIATSTLDGKIQFATKKLVSMMGYASTDELIGRNVMEFIHSSNREKMGLLINELLNGHLTGPAECLLVKKDGSLFYAEANANILCDAGKNPIGILYLERNITERKKAEELLRESEEKFRGMAELLPQIVFESDMFGQLTYINKQAFKILGYPQEYPIKGFKTLDLYIPEDRPRAVENIKRRMAGKLEDSNEYTMIRTDGSLLNVLVYSNPIFKENMPVGLRGIIVDITERKQAEDKLRESEERYRFLTNNIPDIIYSLDGEGNIVTINSPAFEHYGYTEQDSKGKPFLHFIHPEDREIVIGSFLKALEEQRKFTQGLQFRIVAGNGFSYWFELNSQARFGSQGQYMGEEGVLRDITERKLAEDNIHQLNHMGRSISASLNLKQVVAIGMKGMLNAVHPDICFLFLRQDEKLILQEFLPQDASIKLGQISEHRVGECMCGMAVQLNKPLYSVDVFSDRRCTWVECKRAGLKSFAALPLHSGGEVIGVIGLASNTQRNFEEQSEFLETLASQISVSVVNAQLFESVQSHANILEQRVEERTLELRDAQEQLVRHEKLSVLGQMASSVGHELRNPLAVMTSALYYLKLVQPNADEKIKQYLDMLGQEVRTSEKIITDLLDFARIKSVDREAVSVSDLICRTLERFPVPESVESILDIPADLPQVYVDPRQMTQVLGNLVVNACQAMVSKHPNGTPKGGRLSVISTVQNDMIDIIIKDNGTGISPENMKKIFDPLFTTKVKGIGLGLAVSQKLVDANGGSIQVESEAGTGSAFTVSLPIYHPRV